MDPITRSSPPSPQDAAAAPMETQASPAEEGARRDARKNMSRNMSVGMAGPSPGSVRLPADPAQRRRFFSSPSVLALNPIADDAAAAAVDRQAVFSQDNPVFAPREKQVIDPAHRLLTLVTRWKDFSRESRTENERYANYMANSIRKTAGDLSAGRIDNLDQLWSRARQERQRSFIIQKNAGSPDQLTEQDAPFYFQAGRSRQGHAITTMMIGRYAYIVEPVRATAERLLAAPASRSRTVWKSGDLTLFRSTERRQVGTGDYLLRIARRSDSGPGAGKDGGLEISWHIKTSANTGSVADLQDVEDIHLLVLENPQVDHDVENPGFAQSAIYSHVQDTVRNALGATDRQAILTHGFDAYWNLVAAAPDERGSAAKSHYVLQSILLAKGIDLPPARAGLAPDLEAMSRSLDDWLAHAPAVFGLRDDPA